MSIKISDKPLVYIKYLDHALYRDASPQAPRPIVRETIGWLLYEDEDVVWILWDRSVNPSKLEKLDPSSSLVIVKKCILEMRRIG
jgi:hypothetical protein